MLSRGVARHLALVAGVLLCFFVYMGYRLSGRAEPTAAPTGQTVDIAGIATPDANSSLMTMQDGPATVPAPVVAPIDTPTGPASTRPGSETFGDAVSGLQAEAAVTAPAAVFTPESGAAPAAPVAPVGSLEESAGEGTILGLVPSPLAESASPVASAPVAPGSFSADDETANEVGPRSQLEGEEGGGTLRPPSEPPAVGRLRPRADEAGDNLMAAADPAVAGRPAAPGAPMAERQGRVSPQDNGVPGIATPPVPVPPASQLPRTDAMDIEPAASDSVRIYVIRPGDTLSRIATRELGSISLADNIFLLNRDVIIDRDHLVVGQKIRLPMLDNLAGGNGDLYAGAGAAGGYVNGNGSTPRVPGVEERLPAAGSHTRVHRVRPGDTLSSIAQYYYGSSAAWRFLYEANARTLSNPNQLQVGMELAVPPYE